MNLVAHQLLSFQNPQWQIGNHLGEVIKAKDYLQYKPEIQKGVLLHRFIDSYTDQHSLVKNSTALLHKNHSKYSPVIVDVFYDYLLIKNWATFSKISFQAFKNECYILLKQHANLYPNKLKEFTNALIKYDWYMAYSTFDGIDRTLKGLSSRASFKNNMGAAIIDLREYEKELEKDFLLFFPQIMRECRKFLDLPTS